MQKHWFCLINRFSPRNCRCFLFALAILVPIYLAYFAIGIEAERWQAFASVPFGLVFYGLYQFAIYRARRYRLTRTHWRGVRLWMTGSGHAYMGLALGLTLLIVLTLGLAYPWREAALERYKMSHTFYGDPPERFEGKGSHFFKRGWWLWLLALGPVAALVAVFVISVAQAPAWIHAVPSTQLLFSENGPAPAVAAPAGFRPPQRPFVLPPQAQPPHAWPPQAQQGSGKPRPNPNVHVYPIPKSLQPFVRPLLIATLLLFPFIYAAFRATEWKWWAEGIRLGRASDDLRFASDLTRGAFITNIWKLVGMYAVATFAVAVLAGSIVFILRTAPNVIKALVCDF